MSRTGERGWLIAIEGIDGAGKSTFLRHVRRGLARSGRSVGVWREPTDPALGRRAQLAGADDPWEGALWFTLDRARAAPRLERLLARSDVVLADRSLYSTLAYQASALPPRAATTVRQLQFRVARRPDRVIWLRLSVNAALARVDERGAGRAPLERRRTLQRVDRAYERLARGRGWLVLDATRPPTELAAAAIARLERTVARRPRA